MIRAILNGGGRMARSISAVAEESGLAVAAIVSPSRPEWLGEAGHAAALSELDLAEGETGPEIVIDFSLPEGTRSAADWCARKGVPLVSGVTGLNDDAFAALDRAARHVPVLWAPNMSVGVNLLESLCRTVAAAVGSGAGVHVHDVHHQWKKDAPSGTALALGRAVESQRSEDASAITYSSEREGEVVGRHSVRFEFGGEVLELTHAALERDIFARGAVNAALWLCSQPAGRYEASDWLERCSG